MRTKKQTWIAAIAAIGALAVPAVASATIFDGGSTTVQPLAQKLADKYHHLYPHRPKIVVSGGGSNIGVSGVHAGRFNIGNSSRNPERTDPHGLVFIKVARDALCLITNASNPIKSMSPATIEKIYLGEYTHWSQVPGAPSSLKTQPISVFSRDPSSGTLDAFQHIFLDEGGERVRSVTPRATQYATSGQEQQAVRSTPNGIGFVSVYFTGGVHAIPINGVGCTLANSRSGQYYAVRDLWMVTKGRPKGQVAKYLRWVVTSSAARNIIKTDWLPVH